MRELRFRLAFAAGCVLIFAAVELLLWKFDIFVFHHLKFFFGLWFQFNFVPHLFSNSFSGGIGDSPIFWHLAVIEWFIWGIILSFVFTGLRIRCDAKATRAQHLQEIILLTPCLLPFVLSWDMKIQYYSRIEGKILQHIGLIVGYASPLLVIYAFAILIFLAYRKNPLWIKIIHVVLVFYSLNQLIVMATFFTGELIGFEMMPTPG